MCDCDLSNDNFSPIENYFMKQGIERKGLFCNLCGELLDYIPQYNEDD